MVICKVSCSIFRSCKDRNPNQRCIFDLGLFNSEEDKFDNDKGDLLEKIMY